MRKQIEVIYLITLIWSLGACEISRTLATVVGSQATRPPGYIYDPINFQLSVSLQAASGDTILFKTQNGSTLDGVVSQSYELPHLILHQNGFLTQPEARTLALTISGIQVPPPGITLTLNVETQHGDPDLGGGDDTRIPVWHESLWLANTSGVPQTGRSVRFTQEFESQSLSGDQLIDTPSDYFRYDLTFTTPNHPDTDLFPKLTQEYAFLMENQWIERLPDVQEASPGAAPDQLIIHYCDMFFIGSKVAGPAGQLRRSKVTAYIQHQLVPTLLDAFRFQTDTWGFPWYQDWTSYSTGENSQQLSVSLASGKTWYHGRAPIQGHAGISLQITGSNNTVYNTLTEGLASSFHHELFHSLQRNLSQHFHKTDHIAGPDGSWAFFTEGTAILASSIGQPTVQFEPGAAVRSYFSFANAFIGSGGLLTNLNTSYQQLSPYRAAVYWRFLYEQCGGLRNGVHDPSTGMQVIRHALTTLYNGQVTNITTSSDLVGSLPAILDRALPLTPSCPFSDYQQSLLHFARALYRLRITGGRCNQPGLPKGCGFYDPHNHYDRPIADTITYDGHQLKYDAASQIYPAGIRNSFGIDFVNVILDPDTEGHPIYLEFFGEPGAAAEFRVQLWKLNDPGSGSEPSPIAPPELLTETDHNGHLRHIIPTIDLSKANLLGFIITRVDAKESADSIGAYTIILHK